MNSSKSPSYEELERRLEAAETALNAIGDGRVDAVVGEYEHVVVRLAEAQSRQSHLRQVLMAIRNVNQLIVAEDEPRRLIERACVNLTETMGYHNAWIAVMGGETARRLGLPETRAVAAAAAAGFDRGFETLRERLNRGQFPDCMTRALENGNVLVVDDPVTRCPDCPVHAQYGGRAGLVCRLDFDGITYGILTASVPAAFARDAEEQDLFQEVANDLAFALHKIATARKLEQSRRYLALAIEGSGVGTWEWNVQTNETVFNEQWAAMLGYTIKELTPCGYATWERLVHPEDLERAQNALADCIAGRTTGYSCEFRMQHKDGHWVWILDRGRVMTRDGAGHALSMFGTHTDITELRQTEEALQQSKKRHNLAMAATNDGLWDWDVRLGHVYYSSGWGRILGLDTLPPAYETWASRIHEEDRERILESLQRHLSGETDCWQEEHRLRTAAGEWRWVLGRGRVVARDKDGNPLRVVGTMTDIHARKQLQEDLYQSNAFLSTVLEKSPFPMWVSDADGTIIRANQALRQALNLTDAQLVGSYNVFQDKNIEREDRNEAVQRVFERFEPTRFQFLWKSIEVEGVDFSGAKDLYVDASLFPIISDGRLRHVVCQWADITERVHAEERLRESERRLTLATASAGIGIWDWDIITDEMIWDTRIFHLYGIREIPERYGLDYWRNCLHPDDRARTAEACLAAVRGEGDYDVEFRVLWPDGTIRWMKGSGVVIRDDNGKPIRMLGTNYDITERKQGETALRESEQRFQRMLNVVPDMISIHNPEMDILYSNWQGFATVPEGDQCVHVKCYKTYRGFDKPCPDCLAQRVLESREPIHEESQLPDGTWVDLRVIPLLNEDNNVEMFMEWVRDISERKAAEEERERLSDQLQQAQKMESVGRLAGGVAHDFNNMLNVILGHTEIMAGDLPTDSPLHEDVDEIRKAAERSANLTRQLLAFARKQTIAPRTLDLNENIASILKMLRRLIGEDIDLRWKPGTALETVRMDPGQVDQMLANLAVNARDAIGPANGKITIETANARFDEEYCAHHAGFTPGNYVMLAVSDDGCGMDEETRATIFEPFFTTKGLGEGTGLGLATVYGIVKQNDGFINVYSEPGQGTTFKIYLPRHEAKAAPVLEEASQQASNRGQETVLLVEDEPAILKMTTTMLERQGYTVVGASTPGEAIRLATEHAGDIHLIVTDVVMPEMNGRDLAKNVLPLHPGAKCLYMSGYTANVIAHHGVVDEGVNFLQKPFSMKDLTAMVRDVLDRD